MTVGEDPKDTIDDEKFVKWIVNRIAENYYNEWEERLCLVDQDDH